MIPLQYEVSQLFQSPASFTEGSERCTGLIDQVLGFLLALLQAQQSRIGQFPMVGIFSDSLTHFVPIPGDVQYIIRNLKRQTNTVSVTSQGFERLLVRTSRATPQL